jgi:hypothetical protein
MLREGLDDFALSGVTLSLSKGNAVEARFDCTRLRLVPLSAR